MLPLRLILAAILVVASTADERKFQRRQFNAGQDVSYASSGAGGHDHGASFLECDEDAEEIEHGALRCAFAGCRMRCDRGYQADNGQSRVNLACDHSTGKLTYENQPWRDAAPKCIPKCGREGCKNGGICIAPNQCECQAGFTGTNCEIDNNFMGDEPFGECDPPCQNGGICIIEGVCDCPQYYWGLLCELHRCNVPEKGIVHATLGGNDSRMKILCNPGFRMKTQEDSVTILCRDGEWVIPRKGALVENDVKCYPV